MSDFSIFSVATDVEALPSSIRGLTPELIAGADQAVEDGKVRRVPDTEETRRMLGSVSRYLDKQGYRIKTVPEANGTVLWQVVPKRERHYTMTPEHKAKIVAARKAAAKAKGRTVAVGK